MKTNKDLLQHIFTQMEKLSKGSLSIESAREQANLSKQANNALRYELDRAALLLKLEQEESKIQIRDIEN